MRAIPGWLPLGILVTLTLGCGDSEPPEGPSVEGPPFLSATIDGLPWSPDPGDLVAFTGDGISLMARRNAEDASRSEMLRIEFATSDLFRLATYRLSGDNSGFAQFTASFTAPGGSPLDSLVGYTTDAQHIGSITLTGAEVTAASLAASSGLKAWTERQVRRGTSEESSGCGTTSSACSSMTGRS